MDARILKNAVVRDTVQRVRETGLHKVAAKMHGVPEINIKTAMAEMGKALYAHHMKHRAIRSGLHAFEFLDNE
jgi:hypothetical protein